MPNKLEKAGTLAQGTVSTNTSHQNPVTPEVGEKVPAVETPVAVDNNPKSEKAVEGGDLYEVLAKYCANLTCDYISFNDNFNRKIVCYFIDKATLSPQNIFQYSYGKEITSLTISQDMASYGTFASVEITDINGSLTAIVENQSSLYFVVGIIELVGDPVMEDGYMLQPYVFEIENSVPLSPDGAVSKIYRLELSDIISSTLHKVSYGNLLLHYPAFPNSSSFVEAYQYLINFAATIINYNHNKKYHIDTTFDFSSLISDNLPEILEKEVLGAIPLSTNCYEVLNRIFTHAACKAETPATFMGEDVGNVLVPLFLQNEYEDVKGMYRTFFNISERASSDSIEFSSSKNVMKKYQMIKRGFYCKNLLMPFTLAFDGKGKKSLIYENINPPTDENGKLAESEDIFLPSNGIMFSPLIESVDIPPTNSLVGLGWKNLVLLSETPNGSSNMLIYWNWIYEYFKAAFLNEKGSTLSRELGKSVQPVIDPHFHVMEANKLDGGDSENFAKINANTIVLKSTQPLEGALYHVGRSIKSYIFMNSMFGFKIKGSIFRHPGEIIKINSGISGLKDESTSSVVGGLESMKNKFVLAYTTSITHIFSRNSYENVIYANKICCMNS